MPATDKAFDDDRSPALGVACNHCLHRALLRPDKVGNVRDRQHVDGLRIKCSKCGQRDYETVVLGSEREARNFMAECR